MQAGLPEIDFFTIRLDFMPVRDHIGNIGITIVLRKSSLKRIICDKSPTCRVNHLHTCSRAGFRLSLSARQGGVADKSVQETSNHCFHTQGGIYGFNYKRRGNR
jgi:hypothetical protein